MLTRDQGDGFYGLAQMRCHMIGPRNVKTHICGLERGNRHAFLRQPFHPSAIRAKPCPTAATQGQHGDFWLDQAGAIWCVKAESIGLPSSPAPASAGFDIEVLHPSPQQGRGFHRLGKDALGRSSEHLLAKRARPILHGLWGEGLQHRAKRFGGLHIAGQKGLETLILGQVQA